MQEPLTDGAQRIQTQLAALGFPNTVIQLPHSTRTAQEAAEAVGCEVSQIAKSIVFRLTRSGLPLLVVASGTHRVNEQRLAQECHEGVEKADANFVRDHTGFVIGGVPPFGHVESIRTIIDVDLLHFSSIWAAAGHPQAVFELTPDQLIQMTHGDVMAVT